MATKLLSNLIGFETTDRDEMQRYLDALRSGTLIDHQGGLYYVQSIEPSIDKSKWLFVLVARP